MKVYLGGANFCPAGITTGTGIAGGEEEYSSSEDPGLPKTDLGCTIQLWDTDNFSKPETLEFKGNRVHPQEVPAARSCWSRES